SIISWWLAWFALGISYSFISSPIWTAGPVSRFDKSRGMALAGTLLGTAVCALTLPVIVNALIIGLGWRHAIMALSGGLFLVIFPTAAFLLHDARSLARRRDLAKGTASRAKTVNLPGMALSEALRSSIFWRMSAASFLAVIGLLGLTVHFVPILT